MANLKSHESRLAALEVLFDKASTANDNYTQMRIVRVAAAIDDSNFYRLNSPTLQPLIKDEE